MSSDVYLRDAAIARMRAVELMCEIGPTRGDVCFTQRYAMPVQADACGPPRWIMDTGSGYDIVDSADLPNDWDDMIHASEDAGLCLQTAGGPTSIDQEAEVQIGPFLEVARPLILEGSPSVLSVGRRCMLDGYSFHWEPFRNPYMETPDGDRVELEVDGFIPYLRDDEKPVKASPLGVVSVPAEKADSWVYHGGNYVMRIHEIPRT